MNHFIEGAIPSSIIPALLAQNCGAHSLFMGQVRDEEGTIQAIDYTAYREMADEALVRISAEARAQFEITEVHIRHSLGVVKAGELCLLVYVAARHRKAAFAACEAIVERIKSEVPIWGREILCDQQRWKVNR